MSSIDPAYRSPWRASSPQLWGIAGVVWVAGAAIEPVLTGAFSAAGGVAIAMTTPLFSYALAKQHTYELDLKLSEINLRREQNLGQDVLENLPSDAKQKLGGLATAAKSEADRFATDLFHHRRFSWSLVKAQGWIVGISSLIWATGQWPANLLVHCGNVEC